MFKVIRSKRSEIEVPDFR